MTQNVPQNSLNDIEIAETQMQINIAHTIIKQAVTKTLAACLGICLFSALSAHTQEARLLVMGERSSMANPAIIGGEAAVKLPEIIPLAESWSWDGITKVLRLDFENGMKIRAIAGEHAVRVGDRLFSSGNGVRYEERTLWVPLAVLMAAGVQVLDPETITPTPTEFVLPERPFEQIPPIQAEATPTPGIIQPLFPTPVRGGQNTGPSITMEPGAPSISVLIDPSFPPGFSFESGNELDRLVMRAIFDIARRLEDRLIDKMGAAAWLSTDEDSLLNGEKRLTPRERVAIANRLGADLVLSIRAGKSFAPNGSVWAVAYHSPYVGGMPIEEKASGLGGSPANSAGPVWWSNPQSPGMGGKIPLVPWNHIEKENIQSGMELAQRLYRDFTLQFGEGPLPGGVGGPRPAKLALARGNLAPVVVLALGNAADKTTLECFARDEWRDQVVRIAAYSLENWINVQRGLGEVPFPAE